MKDFLSHVDLITHLADEMLDACSEINLQAFDDDVLVGAGICGDLTYGHIRRLRAAVDAYHSTYGKLDAGEVVRLIQSGEFRAGKSPPETT